MLKGLSFRRSTILYLPVLLLLPYRLNSWFCFNADLFTLEFYLSKAIKNTSRCIHKISTKCQYVLTSSTGTELSSDFPAECFQKTLHQGYQPPWLRGRHVFDNHIQEWKRYISCKCDPDRQLLKPRTQYNKKTSQHQGGCHQRICILSFSLKAFADRNKVKTAQQEISCTVPKAFGISKETQFAWFLLTMYALVKPGKHHQYTSYSYP